MRNADTQVVRNTSDIVHNDDHNAGDDDANGDIYATRCDGKSVLSRDDDDKNTTAVANDQKCA